MLASQIPTKIYTPWGASAGGSYIHAVPVASQIGITNGAASFIDGFPPLNFQPVASGGVPPFGQDMNGILNVVTAWLRWVTATGGPVAYDATFQTDIGGYPSGALVASVAYPGMMWRSTADNNTTNPDATPGGAGWVPGNIDPRSRVVTNSATQNLDTLNDFAVALNRTTVAAMTINLAATGPAPTTGHRFLIEDIKGNLSAGVVTVVPQGGATIVGRANFSMAEDFMSAEFRFYSSPSVWSVRVS